MAKPRDPQLALFSEPDPPDESVAEPEERTSEADILRAALERRDRETSSNPEARPGKRQLPSGDEEAAAPPHPGATPNELPSGDEEAAAPPHPGATPNELPPPVGGRVGVGGRRNPTADSTLPPARTPRGRRPTAREQANEDRTADAAPEHDREPRGPAERPVLTVAELDRLAQRVLERATMGILVRGEVTGLTRSGAGHLYFTLKDERLDACVDCMMYRSTPLRARRQLCEGERVLLAGRLTVYAARGRMQLVVEDVLQTARGALLEKLERLKSALAAEGLFDPARKKALPRDARFIAVLTSRSGAAIHDFVRVAHRRGAARIVLVDTPVQGAGAARAIAGAIARADRIGADVLVVTRGGGSAEDLAAYNEEAVVRAIAGARTPVVSAVGHEIDTTLADLAADGRAATPSQAAELLVPDDRTRQEALAQHRQRLVRAMRHALERRGSGIHHLRARLGEPRRLLLEHAQHVDDLAARLERATRRRVRRDAVAIETLRRRLDQQHPRRVLTDARAAILPQIPTLERAMRRELERHHERLVPEARLATLVERQVARARRTLEAGAARLDALSPLSVLARGYAIVSREGHVLVDAADAKAGERVEIRLGRGGLTATIEDRHDPDDEAKR